MKLLASLALATTSLVAISLASATSAMAGDDVTVGVRLGPLCVGLCIGGGDGGEGRHGRHHARGYDYDDDGYYAYREDYTHQVYDRRDYAQARDDGYAGYRRHYAEARGDYDYGDDDSDGDGGRGHGRGHGHGRGEHRGHGHHNDDGDDDYGG